MEQNGKPRKKTPQLYGKLILTRQKRISNREKIVSWTSGVGKLESNMQKNETGPLTYPVHKNELKIDERPKCETWKHKNPREEHRQ